MAPPLKVGDRTSNGFIIREILGQSDRTTVFTTNDNGLRWQYDHNDGRVPDDRQVIIGDFDLLMNEIRAYIPKAQQSDQLKLLGKCLFLALNLSRLDEGKDYFAKVRMSNGELAMQFARFYYVLCCLLSAGVLGLAAWFLSDLLLGPEHKPFVVPAIFGTLGASISVLQRVSSLELNWRASKKMLASEAAARIIVGSFSGVFFFMACTSDLVLGAIKGNSMAINVFAVVAGFSERLIPELIAKFENQSAAST